MEIYQDAYVYDTGAVTIVEGMGRNAGWLTAASALASMQGAGPDLIYLPEVPFDLEKFMADVERIWKEKGNCFVSISEGILDKGGVFIAEYGQKDVKADAFGHKQMGGAAAYLAQAVKERLGAKTRAIEFSLLQRCGAHLASKTDVDEAVWMGEEAVKAAIAGETDKMVAIERGEGEGYNPQVKLVPLTATANTEHKFPVEWITEDGAGIKEDFAAYAMPLIQGEPEYAWENGLPRFAKLKKVIVE
jgi:6-phosphofructokinase 1